MSNAIIPIYKRFVGENSGISCLALIVYLSNLRKTILHSKNRFKNFEVAMCENVQFFGLIDTNS